MFLGLKRLLAGAKRYVVPGSDLPCREENRMENIVWWTFEKTILLVPEYGPL